MKFYRATARALVEREFNLGLAQVKDDNKNKFFLGEAKASVARNFCWALLSKKGAIR